METYGYVRVSTKDQHIDRQMVTMHELHVPERNIYVDRQSGKDFERPMWRKLRKTIKKDDLLYITSIDRLGRNYEEIHKEWKYLTLERGADICVLDMELLDTRRNKDLLGTFLSDVVLSLLSYVAENERNNIRIRQAEGIAAAKARGVRFGRPMREIPGSFYAACRMWQEGHTTLRDAARQAQLPMTTFYRYAQRNMTGIESISR